MKSSKNASPAPEGQEYYTISEIAKLMKVSHNTALKRLRKAEVRIEQWEPGAWLRVSRDELWSLLQKHNTDRDIFNLDYIFDRTADRNKK